MSAASVFPPAFSEVIERKQTYVARIQEVNSTLHVVTELNPDALSIAAQLDAERANGTTRGQAFSYHRWSVF